MNEIRNSTPSLTGAHLDSTTATGKDDPSPPPSPHRMRYVFSAERGHSCPQQLPNDQLARIWKTRERNHAAADRNVRAPLNRYRMGRGRTANLVNRSLVIPRPARAFTLIEVLLAVSVFAIVLIAINTVFYSALRLRATTARVLDQSAPLQQTLIVLRRDLHGAVPPGGVLAGDFKSGLVSSTITMAQYNGIEFYTTTGTLTDGAPWGDLQRVSYQLKEPANRTTARGKDLIRSVTRNLLATMTQESDDRWLMGDVESLDFDCFTGTDWRNSWDTSLGDTNLPTAVRVRIQLAADRPATQNQQPLEMIVPLVSQSRTNQTQ